MKKTLLFGAFVLALTAGAQTLNRTMLIDFGPSTQSNVSITTPSPDANNNYWNNFTGNLATSPALSLVDKANNATGLAIKTLVNFEVNANPGAPGIGDITQLNVAALGDLGVASATVDYFFSNNTFPSLKFTGLSTTKAYKFYVFGCRLSSTDTRVSKYTFTGSTITVGTLKTSEANLGGTGIHANNSSTYNTPLIYADANGEIKLDLAAQTSSFAYINAIKVEEYTPVAVTGISVAGSDISAVNGTSQLVATVLPNDATVKDVTWTVSDPKVATINAAGLLTARKNGTVTVTATTKESGSTVSGNAQIIVTNQPVPVKEMYIDFGPNDGSNGDLTPATADVNGNYWNNVTANAPAGITLPFTPVTLVDKLNVQTGISVAVSAGSVMTNGKLNGALLTPNANYLGELAIPTATEDYFFTMSNGTLTFAGLDVNKGYRFRIFGARDNTETRTSRYKFTGTNIVTGTLQTSGSNLGGTGVNTNNSGIYVSDLVYPAASGEITLYIDIAASSYAYVNTLKLEEFSLGTATGINQSEASKADIRLEGNLIKVKGANSLVELFTATGAKVASMPATVETIIPAGNLAKGIYVVVVDKKQSYKLIK